MTPAKNPLKAVAIYLPREYLVLGISGVINWLEIGPSLGLAIYTLLIVSNFQDADNKLFLNQKTWVG